MTTLVATLGLLPAAMSHGIGSDSQRPFAIVIVGGLMVGMVINIFLLPTLYVWSAGVHDVLPIPDAEENAGQHWSPDVAFSFADRYSPIPGDFTRSEVDRYMGLPAQAISYKVGERTWFEIRADIQSRRGAAFNLKDFHTQALHLGSLGLDQMRREMLTAM